MKRYLVATTCLIAATVACAEIARPQRSTPMSIDQLLTDFDSAVKTADLSSMEQLFLPSDDSDDGQRRQSILAELRKDWKEKQYGPPVQLETTNAVIKLQMTDRDPDGPPTARVSEIELKLVRTENGWRIASMR